MKIDTLLVLGLGRVGTLFAKEAAPYFDVVYGTKRKPSSGSKIGGGDALEIALEIAFDRQEILDLPQLSSCTHVLVTMPPPNEQNKNNLAFLDELTERLHHDAWIGVLSTTAVYGDYQGAWVTEESPCRCPPDSNGAAYLAWEEGWRRRGEASHHCVRVFRCAGIYGSSRSSLHTVYRKGLDLLPKSPVTNRIHDTDLVRAVLASAALDHDRSSPASTLTSSSSYEIYNLADDQPESRQVVFAHAADLLASRGIAIPTGAQQPEKVVSSSRRGQDAKRVDNHKMRAQLLPDLCFPTYKEGLANIIDQPEAPWARP
jgi:hypothetical protein